MSDINQCYRDLMAAIIYQAVEDYTYLCCSLQEHEEDFSKEGIIASFENSTCYALCEALSVSGDAVINKLKEREMRIEKAYKTIRKILQPEDIKLCHRKDNFVGFVAKKDGVVGEYAVIDDIGLFKKIGGIV